MGFFDFLPWNRPERIAFPYRRRMILDPASSRPVVTLLVRGKDAPQKVQFLVDSGADVTSFPLSYAKDVFGITLDKSKKVEVVGISRKSIAGYMSSVDIKIGKYTYPIQSYFIDNEFMPLLGRQDVWRYFNILFDNRGQKVVFERI